MARFREIVEAPPGRKFVLQGNEAFALGVIHAGFHAVDGYPGTPSTEVIDKSLSKVQDKIKVGWSVNEAVAVGVAVGYTMAGFDTVVTMKIPGVFQSADVISTSAFYTTDAGALVIYVATDYVPSSTQHVIDPRYFLASARLTILEPRNHQEIYEMPAIAADLSKKYNTPVVILASGILTHSEGLVSTNEPRIVTPKELKDNLNDWMLMPNISRANYNEATQKRIPAIQEWAESSNLVSQYYGSENWGLIVNGEAEIIAMEALKTIDAKPSILSLGITNPIPIKTIREFAEKIDGPLYIVEDGEKYLEGKLKIEGINIIGKDDYSTITNWTPELVIEFLAKHQNISYQFTKSNFNIKPLPRPPSICPGCPYRAFALAVNKLKKRKKIYASFGDIGCSTLLYFLNALDTVLCMGASDSKRQGFVMARPDMADKVISVIGDSTECHSGLDSTRNAVFRNVPGVKVILDNSITAMTGGQPAPSTETNLAGEQHEFSLRKAVEAEGGRTLVVDSYDVKEVESKLIEALELAGTGTFTTLILEGACINEVEADKKVRGIEIDREVCRKCQRCNICPGIEPDEEKAPHFTNLCTYCCSSTPVCLQTCPFGSIIYKEIKKEAGIFDRDISFNEIGVLPEIDKSLLPDSLRVAIRGIGGQGNLFFGKVLSEVALLTPYADTHIVKGDTHGMAQLGGSVISTFSCGDVHSPILSPNTTDVIIVLEVNEILRPGFTDLLKPGGIIILNDFKALPANTKKVDYPSLDIIEKAISEFKVIKIDANKVAYDLGDHTGRTANVVVLGLLSSLDPFNLIPSEIWQSGLMKVTPDFLKAINQEAFLAGRNLSL